MSRITKAIGGGIGLAAEFNAHRKASKSPARPASDHPQRQVDNDADNTTDSDEETWDLDDVQHEAAPDALSGEDGHDIDEVMQAFFQKHPSPPPQYSETARLPCPVILPQRRPKTNTRGFVRAYAPVLQDCDIDQGTWMDFLNGFHKAIKMSPYFHAANAAILAGAITLDAVAGPSIAIHLTALAIHTSVEASRRGYTLYQTNKYIDTMNDKLFKPRGLYAMIMTYKPTSTSATEVVDLNQSITKAVGTRASGHGSKLSQSSGKTYGELQLPPAAPLIFPALDALSAEEQQQEQQKQEQSSLQKHGQFLSDYYDRRAQAHFEAANPGSKLNVAPSAEFASRYSDPNSAVYSGGLVAMATGGAVPGIGGRRKARRSPAPATAQDGFTNATTPPPAAAAGGGRRGRRTPGLVGTMRKQLHENVLYLMVVNLPSEEELRAASSAFDGK